DYTIETYSGNSSFYAIRPDDRSFWNSGGVKVVQSVFLDNLAAGHEYELEFSAGRNFNAIYDICVKVAGKTVYESTVSSQGADFYSVSFTAPDGVTDSTSVDITLEIPSQYNIGGEGSSFQSAAFLFSKTIEFTDRTDEPGWLGKILGKFTDLGDTIGSFFTSIGDRISGFFSSLWENIKQSFTDLKQWFVDLGNRIQGFFIELYNDIVEGLKKLFIPADGYFDSKKEELETFCVEHFGAMYQVPDMVIDIIEKFTMISPGEPSITVPAIEFDFQGKHYQLTDDISYSFSWVNDSSNALYYFYKFYRGFVTIILFLAFANYCIKKYNEVFAGSDAE
ncbi:MAG TPA: hypothetical protein IAC53_03860, partial [Candidatus Fimenecus excrementigallinarum]|nr:hypothetical protein [Candidatus Fimenecus excrementigallinarum]